MWIIHSGDAYYPSVQEYDDEEEAREAWEYLKRERANDNDAGRYVDIDYIALVVDKNIVGGGLV